MELTLAEVLQGTGARPSGELRLGECVRGWSIDSRTLEEGDLFFAIRGDIHDGHAFVSRALSAGASAAIVESDFAGQEHRVLKVPSTLGALQGLAHFARKRWNGRVVAVTGSAGKTSTKDIIATLLEEHVRVGKTVGNYNNHIGLPLSILRMPDEAEVGVLEMGMNHAGEIRALTGLAEPQVGVITNVGYAHIENFDSIDGIAAAKRELIEALPESGVAILNADDERVLEFRHSHRGRSVTYGFSETSDIRAIQIESGPAATSFTVQGVRFTTVLPGRHSVSNLLAGLAVAFVLGINLSRLVEAVARLRPVKMRGEVVTRRGITILNDSYNSNPEAARRMLDMLRERPAKRRIAVLGEMLELGRMAEKLHRDLGRYVAEAGVDVLIGVGGASRFTVEEAVSCGIARTALFFDAADEAGIFLNKFVEEGDTILFKGSRGTQVEKAIARIEE